MYDVTVNKSYSGCYDKNAADESETKTDNDKIKITIFLRVGHATRLTRVIYEQQQSCLKTLTRPLTVHWRRTRRERENTNSTLINDRPPANRKSRPPTDTLAPPHLAVAPGLSGALRGNEVKRGCWCSIERELFREQEPGRQPGEYIAHRTWRAKPHSLPPHAVNKGH